MMRKALVICEFFCWGKLGEIRTERLEEQLT